MSVRGHRGRATERPNLSQAFDYSPFVGPFQANPAPSLRILVDQNIGSWNHIADWLMQIDRLQGAA
jgi:hypothetical protein